MYPDLLEVFGIQLHGVVFERILWIAICVFMLWGIASSVRLFRAARKTEGIIQGVLVGGVLVWAAKKCFATFDPSYVLTFSTPIVLHSYAFCIIVGIALGIWTVRAQGRRLHFDPNELSRLCFLLIIFGFVGARLAHVAVEFPTYWNSCFDPAAAGLAQPNCMRVLDISEGGLTFYGGVIAGMLVLVWFFIRRYRRGQDAATLSLIDILASALAITHACGRIGCIAAGCCWGAVTTGSFGLRYPKGSFAYNALLNDPHFHDEIVQNGVTPLMHASQLYEACSELAIYGLLWWLLSRRSKPGIMAGTWLVSYGIVRFIVEMLRDDADRGYFFEAVWPKVNALLHISSDHPTILTTSQGIALVMIALGIILLIYSAKKKRCTPPEPTTQSTTVEDITEPKTPDVIDLKSAMPDIQSIGRKIEEQKADTQKPEDQKTIAQNAEKPIDNAIIDDAQKADTQKPEEQKAIEQNAEKPIDNAIIDDAQKDDTQKPEDQSSES